jgi:glutamate dehydrogenase (NADP+)
VGGREIGYMFGQMKRITNMFEGATLTGKGIPFGGSLARTEATGYGLCYFTQEMLRKLCGTDLENKNVVITGSGNVAVYCAEKVMQLGGKVLAMSDSNGYVYDPEGIKLDVVKDIKFNRRGRIKVYADEVPGASYTEGYKNIWDVPCQVAMPCAKQYEIDVPEAKKIIAGGAIALAEGSNMPCRIAASELLQEAGIAVAPAKASNAGGVSTSGLEMSQNSIRLSWSFDEVDARLHDIMVNIFNAAYEASVAVGKPGNLVIGANVASFLKISQAMLAQGVV